jgi:hypothetical protein
MEMPLIGSKRVVAAEETLSLMLSLIFLSGAHGGEVL